MRTLLARLLPIGPFLGMVLAAVLGTLYTALADDVLTLTEVLTLGVSFCGAVTTFLVPRLADATWLKIGASAATAALVAAVAALADQTWTHQDTVTVLIQLLAGLGIVLGTNRFTPEHEALTETRTT